MLRLFLIWNILTIIPTIIAFLFVYFRQKIKVSSYFIKICLYLIMLSVLILPLIFSSNKFADKDKLIFTTHSIFQHKFLERSDLAAQIQKFRNIYRKYYDSNNKNENHNFNTIILFIFFIQISYVAARLIVDIYKVYRLKNNSFVFKKYKNVYVLISENNTTPFAFIFCHQKLVFIPQNYLNDFKNFKITLAHEFEHFKQRDHLFSYASHLLKSIFLFNPFFKIFELCMVHIQELSVDESISAYRHILAEEYCNCLLWAIQLSHQKQNRLCGSQHLFWSQKLFKERIFHMLNQPKSKAKFSTKLSIACLVTFVVVTSSYALSAQSVDKNLSLPEAQKIADSVNLQSEFPISMNDLVLEQLNHYIGTAENRALTKQILTRKKTYESVILNTLADYHLPKELAAIPIVESEYSNYSRDPKHFSAGLWMFITETAKSYGLKVNDKIDERLDPILETQAAAKYLSYLYTSFHDWNLAILAYNAGENNVEKWINETGSRDAWVIVRSGKENDPKYLATVNAAILISEQTNLAD